MWISKWFVPLELGQDQGHLGRSLRWSHICKKLNLLKKANNKLEGKAFQEKVTTEGNEYRVENPWNDQGQERAFTG